MNEEPACDPPGTGTRPGGHDEPREWELRVRGHLGAHWSTWFDGLSLTTADDGTTALRGPVVDQTALHGLLQKLRDLGIDLVSLTPLPPDAPPEPSTLHDQEGH